MRVTIDLDSSSKIRLKWALLKGRLLCGKPADEIYRTRRGFHLLWFNVPITEEQMFRYRKILNDDKKRIELDKECEKKPKQVLFDTKIIRYLNEDGTVRHEEIWKRERIR